MKTSVDLSNIEKVYLLTNNFGINYFLSLYQFNEKNLVIIPAESISTINFIKEIIPEVPIINIPLIKMNSLVRKERHIEQLAEFAKCNEVVLNTFSSLKSSSEIYTFTLLGNVEFIILCYKLQKRGMKINYLNIIDEMFPFYNYEILSDKDLSEEQKIQIPLLCKTIEFDIVAVRFPTWIFFGAPNLFQPNLELSKKTPLTWEEISKKFKLNYKKKKDTVLFIDTDLKLIPGLNVEKSYKKIFEILFNILQMGKKIHVKPHPHHKSHSFEGTFLEKEVEILPKHFPAELIMSQYNEIYGIMSSSLLAPVDGRKYLLFNLLDFRSEEKKKSLKNIAIDWTYASNSKIKIILIDDNILEIVSIR